MTGFAETVLNFKGTVTKRADKVFRKIGLDVATSLILKSPVGDANYWISSPPKGYVGGRFRGNWNINVGNADYSTTEQVDPTGSNTIAVILGKLQDVKFGDTLYISNNLPYAQRLENGWSRQAPQGMVHLTVMEFQSTVSDALRALQSEQ